MYKMSQKLQKLAFFNEHVHLDTIRERLKFREVWRVNKILKMSG